MELHLKIIGILSLALASIHLVFPKYLKWDKELKALSLINQQIMGIHTFFIALIVFLIGVLCLTSANELVNTNLGRKVSLGLGLFWVARLFTQFFFYSPALWKGKTFETIVHVVFSLLWIYLSVIFLATYFTHSVPWF